MRTVLAVLAFLALPAMAQQLSTGAQHQQGSGDAKASATQAQEEDPLAPYASKKHIQEWRAKNPWFGSDSSKTEFALDYAQQLRKERPHLTGRPFLNAVSRKVKETFGREK